MTSPMRAARNAKAQARLAKSLPSTFPAGVLAHAERQAFVPPTPRRCVESYWRHHPLRADRLARALAAASGAPTGWRWADGAARPERLRAPPAPYREEAHRRGAGQCCVCGQPVFRFGWHRDLWGDGRPNLRAEWHACCVVAWQLWTQPTRFDRILRRVARKTLPKGERLWKDAHIDHRVPLFRVWRDHAHTPWPALLAFWGAPNLQVINRAVHAGKTAGEASERAIARGVAVIGNSVDPIQRGHHTIWPQDTGCETEACC